MKLKRATATVATATRTDPDEMLVDPLGKRLLLNRVSLICNTRTQAISHTNKLTHTHTLSQVFQGGRFRRSAQYQAQPQRSRGVETSRKVERLPSLTPLTRFPGVPVNPPLNQLGSLGSAPADKRFGAYMNKNSSSDCNSFFVDSRKEEEE